MLHETTLTEISNNINTGVEYEIALFYQLLTVKPDERKKVLHAIGKRPDKQKIEAIISTTDTRKITQALGNRGLRLADVSFETQNDEIGPADLVMDVEDEKGTHRSIGLSVKYANACTLNVTGKNFITDAQIARLKAKLPEYTQQYVDEMTQKYGSAKNWFRKRKPSKTTDKYIDLIRDAIIDNWDHVENKETLLSAMFHADSPIEFWVVTYDNRGFKLRQTPQTIDVSRAGDVKVAKDQTSYVAFYLDNVKVGHMQVKFNNGFVEKCKKAQPDITCDGIRMSYGKPFSSWNFSVEE